MKLPNPDRAVVELSKLRDYCLSAEHLRGKHKARVFASALGLTAADAPMLRAALLEAAVEGDARQAESDRFGQRFNLDFVLTLRGRPARIRSSWIVRRTEDFPRLTSCYIL
ncbi:MAG: DUF6883 domain-containing protein [Candidatus Binataceae bacterium]